jgi:hypothetical protein
MRASKNQIFNEKEADKNRRRESSSCAVGLVQLFDLQDVLIKTGQ